MTQTSCGSSLSITSSFSCSSRTAEASTLRPSGSDDSFALIGTAGASHSGEERSRRRRELQEMRESSPVCARAPDGAGKAEGETAKGQDLGAEKVLARRSPSFAGFLGMPRPPLLLLLLLLLMPALAAAFASARLPLPAPSLRRAHASLCAKRWGFGTKAYWDEMYRGTFPADLDLATISMPICACAHDSPSACRVCAERV
jgi:hypothetical protein